ncbi:chemotaxis protein [Bacillus cereus group sp. MYBK57-1]|uniref:chemotaxis protein n=1 Tax=Bacillus cereus group sp. MYBK57-1 TaxID=3450619 RepID=UPI003F7AB0BD
MQKIAVVIIHGIGEQKPEFADKMITEIKKIFTKELSGIVDDPASQLIIKPIFWAELFAEKEEELFQSIVLNENLHFKELRRFVIHYLGDAIAYQPVETAKQNYERIHEKIAQNLNEIYKIAGETAPLCVISHSLGSVIASNYFYDLQFKKDDLNSHHLSPLEKGDTLALFYTLGTTLPLWSLRYYNFNRPINIPSAKLKDYYPGLIGEWINFYDKDDILGYPLRNIDESYANAVTEDKEINVGGLITGWNPLSHHAYFTDQNVIKPIVESLARIWKDINHK